jgi:hypothetical protein
MSRGDIGPFPMRRGSKRCLHSLKYDSSAFGGGRGGSCESQSGGFLKIMRGRSQSVFKFDEHVEGGFEADSKAKMDFGDQNGAVFIRSKSVCKLESNLKAKDNISKNSSKLLKQRKNSRSPAFLDRRKS